MLSTIIKLILNISPLLLCVLAGIILMAQYFKFKNPDWLYFVYSILAYALGELCYTYFTSPLDDIFYILFYFFIFLFLIKRNKSLLKNPTIHTSTEVRTTVLLVIDFFIIAILSFLIFYCFDRISLDSQIAFRNLHTNHFDCFLYPVLDFLLIGYYIYINKTFISHDQMLYLPLTIGLLLWTLNDFLFAFESIYPVDTYGISSYLQPFGFIVFLIVLFLLKKLPTKFDYTTIGGFKNNSIFNYFTILMNCIIFIYMALFVFSSIYFAKNLLLVNTVQRSGIILLFLSVIRQMILHFESQKHLHKLMIDANTDPLTGILTRKYAFHLIHKVFKSSKYFNMQVSALMLDIDHFKKINDTHGHLCGDRILQEITYLVCDHIDCPHIVCRYGGEEILVVLPGIDKYHGMLISESIRQSIESHNFRVNKLLEKLTVSIGGATTNNQIPNELDLIKQADAALYTAKKERNKCFWQESTEDYAELPTAKPMV